jgi:single-strand DNA-binding protein
MASLNRCLLIGNLTRDPEIRHTPKGTAVAELGLAINRVVPAAEEGGERREEVVFVDVTLWGRQAEIAQQYLTKGRSVFIEGRLQLDQWDDKQTGQKRSRLKVVGEHLQLLGGRPEKSSVAAPPAPATASRPAPAPGAAAAAATKGPKPAARHEPILPDEVAVDELGDPLDVPF